MVKQHVSVVLVGMAGYGETYVAQLLTKENETIDLVGVVDIHPENSAYYDAFRESGIPIYRTLEAFYLEREADLAIISTPIHLHADHSCVAMENGSHVLCEKPVAASVAEIKRMNEISDKTGRFLAIGFDWSFTPSVQALKKDIIAGKFGKPKRFKSLTLGPRSRDYYQRSDWAGKKYGSNGEAIYDSVANNAFSHYLHHLLYLLGDEIDDSAAVVELTAELYRANPIETFDTCAVKIMTESNVEVLYYASHAVDRLVKPKYQLEFDKATVTFDWADQPSEIVVEWVDGEQFSYPDPTPDQMVKVDVCVEAILTGDHEILCGVKAASSHAEVIQMIHQSTVEPVQFPHEIVKLNKQKNALYVEGLTEQLTRCYKEACLPEELNINWTVLGEGG